VHVFLASFVVGLFMVYLCTPEIRKIYVYPTPDNVNVLLHKDIAGNCFQYHQKEVACPKEDLISHIPVQSG
jgi:hypothetical protein